MPATRDDISGHHLSWRIYFVRFRLWRQPTGILPMNTDAELLQRFVEDRSEAAFTELVQRHLAMVRTTALRRVGGDAHAADDVTQQVFVALARKAPALRGHATLAGWLHLSTHHATASWVRGEQRRKQREAAADSMPSHDSPAELSADAARLRPLLDDALVTLKPEEREAIVLRFFSGRTFGEIGAALALTDEAARKRVDRALEKMQAVLVRRGVTSTGAALGVVLTAIGADPVPAGLALRVASVALTKAAAPAAAASVASVFWPAATAAALIGGIVAIVPRHQANADAAAASPVAPTPAPAAAPRANPAGVAVSVSPEGAVSWDGDAVRLEEFLILLLNHQATAPQGESRIVVNAHGARFRQLNWVLDEVRKVGIEHLVVESDAAPVGPMSTWF